MKHSQRTLQGLLKSLNESDSFQETEQMFKKKKRKEVTLQYARPIKYLTGHFLLYIC